MFTGKAASSHIAWPREDPEVLAAFYGRFKLRSDGLPTAAWEAANLVTIRAPYPLRAAWDPKVSIIGLRCHRLVAESLKGVLRGILDYYGSLANLRRTGMDRFGGAYSFRRISGSAKLSLHAYGAAIDLDPEHNPLGRIWRRDGGMMPMAVVELFEAAGWKWGGRFAGRKDCMHFQATA
jgi:D-alanyl-D-alanine carboxypeptidase-like protein